MNATIRRQWAPWITALVMLGAALALWLGARAHVLEEAHASFVDRSHDVRTLLEERLSALAEQGLAVHALSDSAHAGDAQQLADELSAVFAHGRYPGLQGWSVQQAAFRPPGMTRLAVTPGTAAGARGLALLVPLAESPEEVLVATLDAHAFLAGVAAQHFNTLSIQWFDGSGEMVAQAGPAESDGRFMTRAPFEFGGQRWALLVRSTPAYDSDIAWRLTDAVALGAVFTALVLTALVAIVVQLRNRSDSDAAHMRSRLEENEQRLRLALESTREGWWDWDAATGELHVSARSGEIFGMPPSTGATLSVTTWRQHIHHLDRKNTFAAVRRHIRFDVPFDVSYRIVLPGGVTRWVRTRGCMRRDEAGRMQGFSGFVADVTDARLAQEGEARLAARHASVLTALPDLIFELDESLCFVRYHAANEQDLMMAPEAFLGRCTDEVLPEPVATQVKDACAALRRGTRVETIEYAVPTRDGVAADFEGRFVRIRTGGYLCIIRNITARKAQEAELRRHRDNLAELVAEQTIDLMLAKEAAERARHGQADFLASLSHELRSPLHAIMGFAELGASGAANGARQQHYLERIDVSAQRMLVMVSELLDVSRKELACGHMQLAPVDWEMVCKDVLANYAPMLEAKRIEARLVVSASACPVRADGLRLQQVVENLVTNAIKFSPVDSTLTLTLQCHVDSTVVLEVCDEGIGLGDDDPAHLFDAFVRRESGVTDEANAAGLGLSVCQQYIEAFGGHIEAENRPGGGALFRVSLPCARAAVAAAVEVPEA